MRLEDLLDYLAFRKVADNPLEIIRFRKNVDSNAELCVAFKACSKLYLRGGRADYHMFHRIFRRDEYHLAPLLQRGFDCVMDLGGNVGIFSSRMAPHARRIIVCEPVPENYERLEKNLSGYPHVERLQMAVSSTEETIPIYLPSNEEKSGVFTSYRQGHEELLSTEFIEVPAVSLAELMRRHGVNQVDLLKIDVEGAEYRILHAAEDVLPRIHRIHGEYHDVDRDKAMTRIENFSRWLEEQGYRVEVEHHRHQPNHGMFFASRARS